MKTLTPDEAFAKAAARCAAREYCRADWRTKFLRAGMCAADTEATLRRLAAEGYVDDGRYARAYAHDKWCYDQWGRIKIRQALRLKDIAPEAIDEALAGIDEEAYRGGLRELLARKAKSLRAADERERRMKLARFAAGRGFEPALVFDVLGDTD